MNLDELRLTRRNFLKAMGLTAVGVMVPQLATPKLTVPVEQAPMPCVPSAGIQSFTHFSPMHPAWRMLSEPVMGTAIMIPYNAQGMGNLRLFWTAEGDAEFGWWGDYVESDGTVEEAIPATVGTFPSLGLDAVTRTEIAQVAMIPDKLFAFNLCSPQPNSPFKVVRGGQQIHGLELSYEQKWG